MRLCMCIYTYLRVCMCMYIYVALCVCVCVYICGITTLVLNTRAYFVYSHTSFLRCAVVCVDTHTFVCVCVYICFLLWVYVWMWRWIQTSCAKPRRIIRLFACILCAVRLCSFSASITCLVSCAVCVFMRVDIYIHISLSLYIYIFKD